MPVSMKSMSWDSKEGAPIPLHSQGSVLPIRPRDLGFETSPSLLLVNRRYADSGCNRKAPELPRGEADLRIEPHKEGERKGGR